MDASKYENVEKLEAFKCIFFHNFFVCVNERNEFV